MLIVKNGVKQTNKQTESSASQESPKILGSSQWHCPACYIFPRKQVYLHDKSNLNIKWQSLDVTTEEHWELAKTNFNFQVFARVSFSPIRIETSLKFLVEILSWTKSDWFIRAVSKSITMLLQVDSKYCFHTATIINKMKNIENI